MKSLPMESKGLAEFELENGTGKIVGLGVKDDFLCLDDRVCDGSSFNKSRLRVMDEQGHVG